MVVLLGQHLGMVLHKIGIIIPLQLPGVGPETVTSPVNHELGCERLLGLGSGVATVRCYKASLFLL